jgi:methylenetetrahydrofolate dehydrogenase (NADP+)/methenyltetrahydrofolate cyclohydrolase
MEKILSGKPVTTSIIERTKVRISQSKVVPVMALIKIGSDPASTYYVQNIIKQAIKLGMQVQLSELPEDISSIDFVKLLNQFNTNPAIHAIMIQKPLPKQIDESLIDNIINPEKDIDGINPLNMGRLFLNEPSFVPCTAAAVIELLDFYGITTRGNHVVILGRSAVVGKPLIGLLLKKGEYGDATVTICHSMTKDIKSITEKADIVIAAIGKAFFVTADMIKQNAICVDVGINLANDPFKGNIYVGDFDYPACFEKALAITPVPGGVGSITTAMLLENLVIAAINQNR